MMEVATNSTSEINMLPADSVSMVTVSNVPYLTTETPINTVQCNSHQLLSLYPDATILNNATQQNYILTTNPDGTSTILLDSAQLALLTGQTQTYPVYDGTKVLQFASQEITEPSTVTIISKSENEFPEIQNKESSVIEKLQPVTRKRPPIDDDIQPPYKKGQFKCSICNIEFDKMEKMIRHQRKHAEEKPLKCQYCVATFNLERNCVLHEATHCTENPTCPECKKKFSRVASLKSHILLHEVEENLICPDCYEEFNTQYKYNNHNCSSKVHQQAIEDDEEPTFSCKKCQRRFVKLMHLKDHMKMHKKLKMSLSRKKYKMYADRSSFPHKCLTCGKQFKKPSQLTRHIRIHTGEKPYKCDECSKAFNQKGALQVHMTRHNGFKPHVCTFCSATFSQRGNLRAHINRVHVVEDGDAVHQCPECSCVFKKLGSLHTHLRRFHANSMTHPMMNEGESNVNKHMDKMIGQLLDIATQSNDNSSRSEQIQKIAESNKVNADILQQALENSGLVSNVSEKNTQEKRSLLSKSLIMSITDTVTGKVNKHFVRKVGSVRFYQCIYCSHEFKKPSDLIRHIRIHTHEKPYKCHLCFRAFSVKSTLTAHIRTHSGEKPFRCTTCHKAFASLGSLKVHRLLHTGVKPYLCQICSKAFRTAGHRSSHLQTHQKNSANQKEKKSMEQTESSVNVPDIPLPEPIFITNEGYMQTYVDASAPPPALGASSTGTSSDRPHQCHICYKAFKKSSHLKQHIRSHTGEKPFECGQCHRNFVSNGVLKAHMKTHSGIKAHKCGLCESSFTTRGSLKRHMLIHTDDRPFMCPYCQKTFKMPTTCRKHMRSHRQELAQGTGGGVTVTIVADNLNGTDEPICTNEANLSSMTNSENVQPVLVLSDSGKQATPGTAEGSLIPVDEFDHQKIINHQQNFDTNSSILEEVVIQPEIASNIFFENPSLSEEQMVTTTLTSENMNDQEVVPENGIENTQTVKTKVKTKKTYSCLQCPRVFKKSSHLIEHIRSHSGEKPYPCTLCSRTFVSGSVLRNHIKTHDKSREFTCNICDTGFTTKASLGRHMTFHNQTIQCSYCTEVFAKKADYREHIKMYHHDVTSDVEAADVNEQDKPDILRALLAKRSKAPPIQITEEETEELALQNPEDVETVSEKVLIAAAVEKKKAKFIKTSSKGENFPKYPHACSNCSKSFKKPSDLVRHLRTHTGEKPYICEHCNKSFTVKSTLDSHMKTHSGQKNFSCHVCCSQFATKGSLKVHMRLHTGSKPFTCPYCELNFRTSGHRKSHISSHFKGSVLKRQESKRRKQHSSNNTSVEQPLEPSPLVLQPQEVEIVTTDCQPLLSQTQAEIQQISSIHPNGDGLQLHLTPNLVGQSIQIANVDTNLLSKPIHIDAALLQQLQQQVNINITISPSVMPGSINAQPDPTIIEQFQNHQLTEMTNTGTLTINPNVIIQQLGFTMAKSQGKQDNNAANYSIVCPTAVSEDITLMNNMVGQTISGTEDVVFMNENMDEGSIVIEQCLVEPNDANKINMYDRTEGEIVHVIGMESEKGFTCSVCGTFFNKKNQLIAHHRTHTEVPKKSEVIRKPYEKKKYQCTYCETVFSTKKTLTSHMKRIHAIS